MIYSCAKNKISMICQQLGRGFNDQNIQKKKRLHGTLQDILSLEDSNIHGGNYDSEVRKADT